MAQPVLPPDWPGTGCFRVWTNLALDGAIGHLVEVPAMPTLDGSHGRLDMEDLRQRAAGANLPIIL